jgi:hypothetical protein
MMAKGGGVTIARDAHHTLTVWTSISIMADGKKATLQELLARPPETWVDAVIIAVVKDPYFYGGLALAVFLVLSLVALWATRELIKSIDEDERKKKKREAKKLLEQQQQKASGAGDKKTQ